MSVMRWLCASLLGVAVLSLSGGSTTATGPAFPAPPAGLKPCEIVKYPSLAAFEAALQAVSPDARVSRLGTSAVGDYPIYAVIVGDPSKPVVMYEGVLHGRHEWQSAHFILEFLRRVARRDDAYSRHLLDHYCLVAIPMANPYGYFHGTYHNGHRHKHYRGVNLNRNFPYRWQDYQMPADYLTNPVYAAYRPSDVTGWEAFYSDQGASPGSEPETQAIMQAVRRYQPVAYLALHQMDANPAFAVKNYNHALFYGHSARHEMLRVFQREILPAVEARHPGTAGRGQVSGGVMDDPAYGLSQSYLWTQDALGIPSFVFEAGIHYPQAYQTDLYLEVLYQGTRELLTH